MGERILFNSLRLLILSFVAWNLRIRVAAHCGPHTTTHKFYIVFRFHFISLMHTIVDLLLFIALLFLVPISILFPRSHTLHIPDESVVQSARLKDYYSTY